VKYFICAWYDGAHIRIFLNGADDQPGGGPSASGTASNTDPLYIGCQSSTFTNTFPRIIEDVRFYNRTLNEEGIRSLYQARGGDRNTSGLQARWKLNEGHSGQSAIHRILDSGGGNNYNGYVVAAPTLGTYTDQLVVSVPQFYLVINTRYCANSKRMLFYSRSRDAGKLSAFAASGGLNLLPRP
jgi:hypothetical protein